MQTIIQKLESILSIKKAPSPEEKELFQKTQYFIQYIKWIPGLRMVAVSNSLSMYATHPESDIDLFIITAPKRLWIVRTLVLGIAMLLGVRTKPGNEAGKFCFPFFMTEKNLSLKKIALMNDVYLAYWTITLKPIFNTSYTYSRFMEVNRDFCEKTLELQLSEEERAELLSENKTFLVPTRKNTLSEYFWDILSPILSLKNLIFGFISKTYITKKIPSEWTDGIVVNDDMVKLHFNDRRKEIREKVF